MIKIVNGDCRTLLKDILEENRDRNVVIVSDPPFNIGYRYKNYKDKMKENDYINFMNDIFSLRPCVIIHYPEMLFKIALKMNKAPTRVVSWVYNSNTARQHRDIAFFDIKPNFKQVVQPYKNLNDKRIKERIARGIGGGDYMIGGMLIRLRTYLKKKLTTLALCHYKLWKISSAFFQKTC